MRAVHAHSFKNVIDGDNDLSDDFKVTGTPHFFVNGRRIVGAQPFEKFQGIIDEQLTVAKTMVERGTPPKQVYDQIMKTAAAPEPLPRKLLAIPARALPFKGGERAKVVIQEIGDFQCPFCKQAKTPLNEVLSAYGNKVKIVFRHLPLPMHADALLAAEAAEEALKQKGSDGFWKMSDLLFDNQLNPDGLKRPALEQYAVAIGLDLEAFRASLDSHAHQADIDADVAAAAAAGITGTPAFVINGYFISGTYPFPKFRRIIDRALAEASPVHGH